MKTINISSIENNTVQNISVTQGVFIVDHTPNNWIALVMLIGILFFNVLLIVLLLRRQKRSRMAFFVQNLAFSDICVGLFYLLPQLLFNYFVLSFWNNALCKAFGYLHMMSFHVSTNAIVVLTIDRLFVIQFPLSTISKRRRYRYGLTLTAWILGILSSIPYGIFYRTIGISCHNTNTYIEAELWISSSLLIFIPVAVIVISYCMMVKHIQKRNSGFFSLQTKDDPQSMRHQSMVSKTKIRTIKLLLIVVIVYIICWGPIFVGSIFHLYGIVTNTNWISTSYALAPLNSLANPIVFLIFNRKMFLERDLRKKGNCLTRTRNNPCCSHSETFISHT